MTEIAMLYDRSETDELGIRMTAEKMGVDLGFIPFHKVAFGFDTNGFDLRSLGKNFTEQLKDVRVVLNRTQSKSRRLYAANIFDVLGTDLLNPLSVELTCQSKVRTLLSFARNGILVPKTVYVPSNAVEQRGGNTTQDNSAVISKMIHDSFDSEKVVLKPDAGTHGKGVGLFEGLDALQHNVQSITPSIINTAGVVAQEFIPKWFYDLRILVKKEKDEPPHCHETALARGGFAEFRTNTFLGNMVFRAKLPQSVRREAEKCGEIIANGSEAWVVALDAMPRINSELREGEDELKAQFEVLNYAFEDVKRVKRRPSKKRNFSAYTNEINNAYTNYMESEAYAYIETLINDTLEKVQDSIYFHEGNACPEFWEQTRIVGGVNLAEDLLRCASSLLDV